MKRLKWGSIENLERLIDEYFENEPIPTIAGLRVYLGISDNCWRYYVSETWKTHRKSEEEIEEITKKQTEIDENEIFEELMEISDKSYEYVDYERGMNIEDDNIKALVSLALKKARDRIEVFINKQLLTAKNPAGPIFYAKAALGYRETDQEQQQQLQPTKITINILPAPDVKQFEQVIDVTPDRPKLGK